MKILIVDDSPPMRKIIMNAFHDEGINDTIEAGDGVEALSKLTKDIDIIVTDWNMPNMDGITLIKEVRKKPEFKNTLIMVVTTEGSKEQVIEAIKSGANNYVVKPFTKPFMKQKIQQMLKSKGM